LKIGKQGQSDIAYFETCQAQFMHQTKNEHQQ